MILDRQSTEPINFFVMNFSQIELNFKNFSDAKFMLDNINKTIISQDLNQYIESGLNTIILGDCQIAINEPAIIPDNNNFLPTYQSVIFSASHFQNLGFNLTSLLESLDYMTLSMFSILLNVDENYSPQVIGSAIANAIKVPEHLLHIPNYLRSDRYQDNVREVSIVLVIGIMMIFETLMLVIIVSDREFSKLSNLIITRFGKTREINNIQSKTNLMILLLEYFVYLYSFISIFTIINSLYHHLSFQIQELLLATLYIPVAITIPHMILEIMIKKSKFSIIES